MTAGAGLPLSMAAFIFSQIASRRAYQSILGFEEPFGRPPLLRISSVRLGSAIGVCSICSSISVIVPPCSPFPLLQPHGWRLPTDFGKIAQPAFLFGVIGRHTTLLPPLTGRRISSSHPLH